MRIETTLEQMRADMANEYPGDWGELWGHPRACGCISTKHLDKPDPAPPQSKVSLAAFRLDDVEAVIGSVDGEEDGDSWVTLAKLRDGRFAVVHGGCSYMGWGCLDGCSASVAHSLEDAVLFGLTEHDRRRLGIESNA